MEYKIIEAYELSDLEKSINWYLKNRDIELHGGVFIKKQYSSQNDRYYQAIVINNKELNK